jgi:hypothetical protein
MGQEARLRAIKTLKIEGVSRQYLLEQWERPEGPWLVDCREFSTLLDLEGAEGCGELQ